MLEDTVKRHEENVLATSLMTMSQMPVPDVARELAEASALHALFAAVQRDGTFGNESQRVGSVDSDNGD